MTSRYCANCGMPLAQDVRSCPVCLAGSRPQGASQHDATTISTQGSNASSPPFDAPAAPLPPGTAGYGPASLPQFVAPQMSGASLPAANHTAQTPPVPFYPAPVEKKVPPAAIISLAVSLAGLLLFIPFAGIISIVLATVVISQFDPATQKYKGLAIAGLVIGILDVSFWVFPLFRFLL